jgi:hypothetical protein
VSDAIYPVVCTCGTEQLVPITAAGSIYPCTCGLSVTVPSYRELKLANGESIRPIATVLRERLAAGTLPEESDCVLCEEQTDDRTVVTARCEKATIKLIAMVSILFLFVLLTCFVGLLPGLLVYRYLTRGDQKLRHGRELTFKLPVCVCRECVPKSGSLESRGRELLDETPLYRQLLQKYPAMEILKLRTVR